MQFTSFKTMPRSDLWLYIWSCLHLWFRYLEDTKRFTAKNIYFSSISKMTQNVKMLMLHMRKTPKFVAEHSSKNFLNRRQLCFVCNYYELIFSTFNSTHSQLILLLNSVMKRETFNLLPSKKKSQSQGSDSQSCFSLEQYFPTRAATDEPKDFASCVEYIQ
jgi:hypothetical protein